MFKCPSCPQQYEFNESNSGKVATCSNCGQQFLIPAMQPLQPRATAPAPEANWFPDDEELGLGGYDLKEDTNPTRAVKPTYAPAMNRRSAPIKRRNSNSGGGGRAASFIGLLVCTCFIFIYGVIVASTGRIHPKSAVILGIAFLSCLIGTFSPRAAKNSGFNLSLTNDSQQDARIGCMVLALFGIGAMIFVGIIVYYSMYYQP
jgi:hypothetical protein